jgi:tRNA modification GTPase
MDNLPIIAIATPAGNGGVGIVRISGINLRDLIYHICKKIPEPRYACLLSIYDIRMKFIDKVIALHFSAPNSYTGEDILELQAHGGAIILDILVQHCLEVAKKNNINLRLARAGEFTERAFLNGKIDLIQAEAIADMIHAQSIAAVRCAGLSLQGQFSTAIHSLLNKLIHLRLLLESSIDFPEEDLDYTHMDNIQQQFIALFNDLNSILQKSQQGYILKQGIRIALVGKPNVGKSSLMNALAQKDVAIVTPIAGTTRDKIELNIQIAGVDIHITDTAGLRDTADSIEAIGIERTWQAISECEILLYIEDAQNMQITQQSIQPQNTSTIQQILSKYPHLHIIYVYNKMDLMQKTLLKIKSDVKLKANINYISAKYNQGLDELRQNILQAAGYHNQPEGIFLARKRHIDALNKTHDAVQQAYMQFQLQQHIDIVAEDLRVAQNALNSITGECSADDLLGKIFSEFCIGK